MMTVFDIVENTAQCGEGNACELIYARIRGRLLVNIVEKGVRAGVDINNDAVPHGKVRGSNSGVRFQGQSSLEVRNPSSEHRQN
jgi:hypothetical protein